LYNLYQSVSFTTKQKKTDLHETFFFRF